MNIVVLEGVLSSEPVVRELPSSSVLCSLEVTTRDADGVASSVPVAWFDPPNPPGWPAGTEVVVVGSVRRRYYRTAGGATQSRTEVVADQVAAASEKRRAGKLVGQAVKALGGVA